MKTPKGEPITGKNVQAFLDQRQAGMIRNGERETGNKIRQSKLFADGKPITGKNVQAFLDQRQAEETMAISELHSWDDMPPSLPVDITGPDYGFVYVMSYPNHDHLKIGHSLDPIGRANDIGGTKGPEKPIVVALFWCSQDRQKIERKAHSALQHKRGNGEWFDVDLATAIKTIEQQGKQEPVPQVTYLSL